MTCDQLPINRTQRRNPDIEESLTAFFGDDLTSAHLKLADTPVSSGFTVGSGPAVQASSAAG